MLCWWLCCGACLHVTIGNLSVSISICMSTPTLSLFVISISICMSTPTLSLFVISICISISRRTIVRWGSLITAVTVGDGWDARISPVSDHIDAVNIGRQLGRP
jgi:hypothetical protein